MLVEEKYLTCFYRSETCLINNGFHSDEKLFQRKDGWKTQMKTKQK